jgi:hypothetical protein
MSSHLLRIHARTTSTQGTLWLVIALLLLCATALAQVQTGTTPAFGLAQYKAPADAGGDLPQNTYTLDGRIDFNPTDKTQTFFRFGRESLDAFLGTASASPTRSTTSARPSTTTHSFTL